jgi:hypothetical protein
VQRRRESEQTGGGKEVTTHDKVPLSNWFRHKDGGIATQPWRLRRNS